MQALQLVQLGQIAFLHLEEPGAPGPGEALVRIKQIGVCGTDLHPFQGNQPFFHYPRILGHELGVEVVAVHKDEQTLTVGMRRAVEPYFHCGHCPPCLRGKPNCCLHIQVFGVHIDGGMRELAHISTSYLHPSASLSFE